MKKRGVIQGTFGVIQGTFAETADDLGLYATIGKTRATTNNMGYNRAITIS
jgi:hypothetical protein